MGFLDKVKSMKNALTGGLDCFGNDPDSGWIKLNF